MTKRKHWFGLVVLVGLLSVAAGDVAWADCGTCQTCKDGTRALLFEADYCMVANNENGSMCCKEEDFGLNTFCTLSGNACYGIIVDGGGGSGGGGGGTTCNYQNGWCPAECMSCSGGGRPAI